MTTSKGRRKQTAKERVLARYPGARIDSFDAGGGSLFGKVYFVVKPVTKWEGISEWEKSEDAAWADAASRLRRSSNKE